MTKASGTNVEPRAEERWSIGRLLKWTADYLGKKGAESPRLDAELLLAKVLGVDRVKLYTNFDQDVSEKDRAAYRELVRKRADGAPAAYLVGSKEFYSLTFEVNPSVLIPRPDSEFLVVEFLARFREGGSPRFVDVGTGSGCLVLACLHRLKTATALASDVSSDALDVASRNAKALGLNGRVEFRAGSLLEPFEDEGPFDAVISNPPYIRSHEIDSLGDGVGVFEPRLALDGGADGLRVIEPLIRQAAPLLKPGGRLIFEIGHDQGATALELIESTGAYGPVEAVKDHSGHRRVLSAPRV